MVPKERHNSTTTTAAAAAESSDETSAPPSTWRGNNLVPRQLSSAYTSEEGHDHHHHHHHHNGYYYLTPDAREKLPHYQYRGADHSLLYQYVLSPLASFLVDNVLPTSMAPNTVTSIGLIWMITSYCIYWWYVPTFHDHNDNDHVDVVDVVYPPKWIFLWNGISMLAYQTLDNMDGKQARRTKSSSPLGLLFDHGCDAINSIFGSANWIIGMQLIPHDNLWETWALIFGPFALFYIATWEQFYTGELIMPIINGPNEGLMGGVLLSFTSFWFGSQFWQQTDFFDSLQALVSATTTANANATAIHPMSYLLQWTGGVPLRNCDFVILAASGLFLQEIVLKSFAVIRKYKGSALALLPFIVLASCFWIVGYINPNLWLQIPRTSLHLAMILFVEMSTEIMLAHVTAQRFNPWKWQVVPLAILTCYVAMYDDTANIEMLQYWVIAYTWSMGAYLTMKCALVIHEMCEALDIWCFDIVTPRPKKIIKSHRNSSVGSGGEQHNKKD